MTRLLLRTRYLPLLSGRYVRSRDLDPWTNIGRTRESARIAVFGSRREEQQVGTRGGEFRSRARGTSRRGRDSLRRIEQRRDDVHRQREDDGRVLVGRDHRQGL